MADSYLVNRRRLLAVLGAAIASHSLPARSQDASRRVTLMVGFNAGGAPDVLARVLAEHLRAALNHPSVVENRAGAAGQLAMQVVVNAPQGSTTLVVSPSEPITLYPLIFRTLPYDPERDFVPLAGLASNPYGIAVSANHPARNLSEFVLWCKENSKIASFGTPGAGTPHHFIGALFSQASGAPMLHVPYKSNVSALQDLLGGQISTLISALPQIVVPAKSGRLRVLAVTGKERSEALPEAPTFREAGYDGFFQLGVLVLLAPRKTPSTEMNVLSEAVLRYVRTSEWANAIGKFGQSPHPKNSAEMQREFADAAARWRAAIKTTGFKPEE